MGDTHTTDSALISTVISINSNNQQPPRKIPGSSKSCLVTKYQDNTDIPIAAPVFTV